ncbi:hypothetical protein GO755_33445 [Spirosoma sp. HMF4905]|uniref:Uncharacterized protein n=1 Tax=Spirosoma arboris TaxID=2682092 RepID=A0A7K1SMF1_9BACT|nr:hypothetical protein [Spirosoma arboris]MVM34981.1 hypothetical protein [Spirosoma arboris]
MPTNQPSETPTIDRAQEAAQGIFNALNDEGLSTVDKVAACKLLDQMIRQEIDQAITALQQLRTTF